MDVKCYKAEEVNLCYPPMRKCRAIEALTNVDELRVCSFGDRDIGGFKVLGIGFRGVVVLGKYMDNLVAIKLPRADWQGSFKREAEIQRLAYPVSPKIYYSNDNMIIMEYISCPDIKDILPEIINDVNELRTIIKRVLFAGRELDKRGIDHGELVRPWKHIKVCKNGTVRILDYGSASLARKVRNVSSLISGLMLKPTEPALTISKVLGINKALLLEKLKLYKRNMTDEAFKELLEVLNWSGST